MILVLFAALCMATVVVKGDDEVNDPDVLKLTESTFDSLVNPEDTILVEFYAPVSDSSDSIIE